MIMRGRLFIPEKFCNILQFLWFIHFNILFYLYLCCSSIYADILMDQLGSRVQPSRPAGTPRQLSGQHRYPPDSV